MIYEPGGICIPETEEDYDEIIAEQEEAYQAMLEAQGYYDDDEPSTYSNSQSSRCSNPACFCDDLDESDPYNNSDCYMDTNDNSSIFPAFGDSVIDDLLLYTVLDLDD